ncbi:ATP-binding protein [Azospirillum sp. A39]|uniref:ATP-binding protein n=1 Tax=Azospirillum sp. A39 TaxID=3462279 RepID=UPI004045DA0E
MTAGAAEQGGFRTNGSERKLVTVMFADIVGSSAMVAGRDPEDADDALLAVIQVLVGAVQRYGGIVGQVLGDGVLAVFGAPEALEDHALRACLAAQDIIAATRSGGAAGRCSVRVGVASGEVVSEVVASELWTDYRTVGECVHLAAKLQQATAPDTVLLSATTVGLVPSGLVVDEEPAVALGPEAPRHPVFRLVSVQASRLTAIDVTHGHAATFVGREGELRLLTATLERCCGGGGEAMLVVGEAGIGKSRLVGEFLRVLPDAGADLLAWPQAPVRRLGEPDDIVRVARSLAALAGRRTGADGDAAVCAAAAVAGGLAEAAVCDLLGRPARDPMWAGLDSSQRLSFAIEGLVVATTELAADGPLVVLVEDAHWATPVMGRLLDTLAHSVTGTATLLLATARPDEPAGWSGVPRMRRIDVNALTAAQTDEFLDLWLGDDPDLESLKRRVAKRSQGVPLYLEESLRAMEASGAIAREGGRYRLGDSRRVVDLPPSVRGLIAARIDSLGKDARAALRAAAVIGPTFDVGLLRQLAPVPANLTMTVLAGLEQAGFLHRSRLIPNLEFTFRHALVQEVAYAGITRRQRPALHARVLRALRERRDRDLPGRLELLAHHASRAEDWPLAYVYGRFAGQRAEARSKLVDACQFFEDALAALERLPAGRRNTLRRIDLRLALARSIIPLGIRDGVVDHLMAARALATTAGDVVRLARASSLQSSYLWVYGDLDQAIALSLEGLAGIEGQLCTETRVQLLVRLAGELGDSGRYGDACRRMEEARRLIEGKPGFGRFGLTLVATVAVDGFLARCYGELGRPDDAERAGASAMEVASASGHAFSRIVANLHLGLALLLREDFERSVPLLREGLATAEAIRSQIWQPLLLSGLGYALVRCGQGDGLALLRAGRDQLHKLRQDRHLPQILVWLSLALTHEGQALEGRAVAEDAVAQARRAGQRADEAWAHYAQAAALTALGERAGARAAFEAALAPAGRLDLRPLARHCAHGLRALRALDAEPERTTA